MLIIIVVAINVKGHNSSLWNAQAILKASYVVISYHLFIYQFIHILLSTDMWVISEITWLRISNYGCYINSIPKDPCWSAGVTTTIHYRPLEEGSNNYIQFKLGREDTLS